GLSVAQGVSTMAPSLVVLVVVYALFYSLRVVVDGEKVHAIFGVGIIRFSYRLEDVESARPVRNRWYHGWGVRLIRGGVLLNVAGLDAVEFVLRSGGVRRIGTDEPEALLRAVNASGWVSLR
ncbi:MAG TPA: hypothetical protein VM686_05185, partial [Polyangiaceae bacterium]|nr:hypothetical protein [Polyangiaceae bacterium]